MARRKLASFKSRSAQLYSAVSVVCRPGVCVPVCVCHESEFCGDGWTDRVGCCHGGFLRLVLRCVFPAYFRISKNNTTFFWNSVPNYGGRSSQVRKLLSTQFDKRGRLAWQTGDRHRSNWVDITCDGRRRDFCDGTMRVRQHVAVICTCALRVRSCQWRDCSDGESVGRWVQRQSVDSWPQRHPRLTASVHRSLVDWFAPVQNARGGKVSQTISFPDAVEHFCLSNNCIFIYLFTYWLICLFAYFLI